MHNFKGFLFGFFWTYSTYFALICKVHFYISIKSHPLNYRIYCLRWKKLYIWVTFHCQKTFHLWAGWLFWNGHEHIFRANQHLFTTWAHSSCWLLWGPMNLSQLRGGIYPISLSIPTSLQFSVLWLNYWFPDVQYGWSSLSLLSFVKRNDSRQVDRSSLIIQWDNQPRNLCASSKPVLNWCSHLLLGFLFCFWKDSVQVMKGRLA